MAGLNRIVSDRSGNTIFYVSAVYWLDGTYGTDGLDWELVGPRVGQTDVSTRRNGSATMGAGTGAPSFALEERRSMGSGGWRQLHRCCKDAEYFFWKRKIIQIECT